MKKLQISVIDFLPQAKKFPIGQKDKNGAEIHYGDTIEKRGEKLLVGYRYGKTVLKPFNSAMYIGITDYSQVEILNEMSASMDYLIVGTDDEPFIKQLAELTA